MVSRAVLAFQRFIRDLIRAFRQSYMQSVGALQPSVGVRKRKRITNRPYWDEWPYGAENFDRDNEDYFL